MFLTLNSHYIDATCYLKRHYREFKQWYNLRRQYITTRSLSIFMSTLECVYDTQSRILLFDHNYLFETFRDCFFRKFFICFEISLAYYTLFRSKTLVKRYIEYHLVFFFYSNLGKLSLNTVGCRFKFILYFKYENSRLMFMFFVGI